MDEGNLAMTYSALATLITLEADLADVDGEAIVRALGSLQQEDGRWGNREGTTRGIIYSHGGSCIPLHKLSEPGSSVRSPSAHIFSTIPFETDL